MLAIPGFTVEMGQIHRMRSGLGTSAVFEMPVIGNAGGCISIASAGAILIVDRDFPEGGVGSGIQVHISAGG
jgi:hypothetical protein